ncbi:hypothetical protein L1S35_02300 [Flavobacterium sp. AS60]|uniref:hypothetical protein n=1 Tax=Flavobacterium anseongense TaxID=2910677 RepID=UPI001F48DD70|nr:hypothetical protein [Flavobacterium sp. AS60]MCF6128486.1 hypothetical protein [Flavobacterium sp. AS60]
MKKTVLIFIATMLLTACSSDSNPEDGLPKETQTGANTFGCLIDGKLLLPRSGNNNIVDPLSGATLWGGYPNVFDYFELEIIDYKSAKRGSLLLHMHDVVNIGIGEYTINESNGMDNVDGLNHTYLHCVIFDKNTNSYQQYVSFENSGTLSIKRLSINASSGNIVSGTFNCRVRNIQNPSDEIEITNGRFDVNSHNLSQKYFP